MKDDRKTEIRVGLMAIAGIIIFLWILGWAKNFSFTSTEKTLQVSFPEVAGLEIGDYVTVNGVRKGNVTDIVVGDNEVIVKMNIDKNVSLKEDAQYFIVMLDLMGGKKVEIKPGLSANELELSDVQQGKFSADIPTVLASLGDVQDDLVASVKDLRVTLAAMNEYLTDEELNKNIRSSVRSMNDALLKINNVLDQSSKDFSAIARNAALLSEDTREFMSSNKLNLSESVTLMRSLLVNTDSLVARLNYLAAETRAKENNLGKLLYNEELMEKLDKTINQLNLLITTINDQLNNEGLKVKADVDIF